MTGRFSFTYEDWNPLLGKFGIHQLPFDFRPRYNIAPTQVMPVIYSPFGSPIVEPLRWGLIPYWAKDENIASHTINARAETLLEKPSFKHLVGRNRCLVPADGFYEWKKTDDGKQPLRIVLKNRPMFTMAGLYDTWTAPNGQRIKSFTIITTHPNRLMEEIHNRMPVILPEEHQLPWLDPTLQIREMLEMLKPYDSDDMRAYPVSPMVGNVKNDVPECIAEWDSTKKVPM